jgi:hypothetical protein
MAKHSATPHNFFCGFSSGSLKLLKAFLTIEEKQVEQHFTKTHLRQLNDRFVVCLPTKQEVTEMGDIYRMALTRFGHLECKFSRNEHLKIQY